MAVEMQTESINSLIELAKLIGMAFAAGTIVFKMGAMTQKFELIGRQQAKEISELKATVEKLADNSQQVQVFDERLLAQGKRMDDFTALISRRLDELTNRLNTHLDRETTRSRFTALTPGDA